ncbi:MAG: hypothetical protein ACREUZ_06345 [Burkholderiales bacterium]
MAKLKAGTVFNFNDSLAAEMEAAMKAEWLAVKGEPLPSPTGEEDRKIMFVAIARGLLQYLQDHRDEIFTTEEDGDHEHEHTIIWEYE